MKWLHLNRLWPVFRGALFEWNQDKAPRMAAALAFYTIFSLTPIVIISVGIGGTVFGRDAALREVLRQVTFLVGPAGGEAIEMLVKNAPERQASMTAVIFGVCVMLFAATGAFAELKDSMNTIWEVQPAQGLGLKSMVWDRLISFAMVLVVSFLLLVSLVASMFLQVLVDRVAQEFALFEVGYALLSVTMVTFLFALMYKVLPDAYVAWRDVWLGAFVAASLFVLGRTLFGLYLGHSTIGSSYGAAGSLVIVVLWTYYSALILLFGAEMTQVQARLRGETIVPKESAVRVTEHDRVQQGAPHGLPDAPPVALD
jgi:membrane protein